MHLASYECDIVQPKAGKSSIFCKYIGSSNSGAKHAAFIHKQQLRFPVCFAMISISAALKSTSLFIQEPVGKNVYEKTMQ